MDFDESPMTAEPARILKILRLEVPTWSAPYLLPRLGGLVLSLVCILLTGLGLAWWLAARQGLGFPNPGTPVVVLGWFVVALLVGRYVPRPDLRKAGQRRGERDVRLVGCLGMGLAVFGGSLYDFLEFAFRGARLQPADLDLATTVVQACLGHPGARRDRIVKAVVKARKEFSLEHVNKVLDELVARRIVKGQELLRVPPDRARDFGATEIL